MERKHKPSTIPISPSLPQAAVDVSDYTVKATLPSRDTVTINLFGATVTSWTLASGEEQLFLSSAAKLDGSKAIRGGIPIVFPVFGPPSKDHATGKLPQHGFARSVLWEFLGKNTSESRSGKKGGDEEVKLDFGLSSGMLPEEMRQKWPYEFGLVYSVTLGKDTLETGLHVQNTGGEVVEFQALFHNYLRIEDISQISIHGLSTSPYVNKTTSPPSMISPSSSSEPLTLTSETDRVYSSLKPSDPVTVQQSDKTKFILTREGLTDCTVWNPWQKGAEGMGDFEPKDGWRQMICVEPGAVSGWVRLEAGDAWEGGQVIKAD
ncbi:hypothetical protein EPUS_05866 [Endocarpon pusillum Z07020]|uniref:Glucose-6-phosphate 1-epimerase n=1 Tax=Endocarpon pusillum (strain Z07020 / HMAS-L-300199) TaxID=1263415 RepID=U1GVT3_ENDPU|nr:uncharacterized protein EPUS_05866 [Endocarpon pusillum Z07020]ERF76593.1 hypothetical protein EPUS_05866 [Endocarpon pusillum Z07020]